MMCWSDVISAVPCSNVGVTAVLTSRVTRQVPTPVHTPDHPAKVLPDPGVAANTTAVPLGKLAVQVCGQLIPAGVLVTVPVPVPARFTVSWIPEEPAPTVIVTEAEAVPPGPVAVAVNLVVEVGLTDTTPPPAAIVRLLPLVPVIVIPVAFLAVTLKTEELPLVIDVGLALIVTVGAGKVAAIAWLLTNAGIAHGRSIERT